MKKTIAIIILAIVSNAFASMETKFLKRFEDVMKKAPTMKLDSITEIPSDDEYSCSKLVQFSKDNFEIAVIIRVGKVEYFALMINYSDHKEYYFSAIAENDASGIAIHFEDDLGVIEYVLDTKVENSNVPNKMYKIFKKIGYDKE